jgi:hypothetical protein
METRGQRRSATAEPAETLTFTTAFTVSTEWREGKNTPKALKVMVCNYCKHQEAYNVFHIETHLATCKEYMLSQMYATIRRNLEDILATSVDEFIFALETEVNRIRDKRFRKVLLIHNMLLAD